MNKQLSAINTLEANIELISGLHIGAGNDEIRIGGIDNPVTKHPYTNQPYIPGSSLKGKARSLMEWKAGLVSQTEGKPVGIKTIESLSGAHKAQAEAIAKLFGVSGDSSGSATAEAIGPTRVSFWDCALSEAWLDERNLQNQLYTESKSENSINRISGTADNLSFTERVPSGAIFNFKVTLKQLQDGDEALLDLLLTALKMLEMDAIGGSGSRGYGKIRFNNIMLNGESIQEKFSQIDPFSSAA